MASNFFSKSKRKASGSATEEELTKKKKGNAVSIETFNSWGKGDTFGFKTTTDEKCINAVIKHTYHTEWKFRKTEKKLRYSI